MAAHRQRTLYSSLSSKFAKSFSDSVTDFNPYQPPSELEESVDVSHVNFQAPRVARGLNPITFSGSIGTTELARYLAKDQDAVGCAFPALGSFFLAFTMLWAFMVGQSSMMMLMLGVSVLGTLVMVTSSRWYRHIVFRSSNTMWDQPISGEMTQDGVRVDRKTESVFYQWNWFSGVAICEGVVGFVPSIPSEPPVIVGTNMLTGLAGEDELFEFARKVKVVCLSEHANEHIAFANQQVMQSPERSRTAPNAPDAIMFEGRITGADTRLVPSEAVRQKNTERAVVIRFVILVGLGLIAASLMTNWLMGLLVLCAVAALIFMRRSRRKKSTSTQKMLYYLIGDADADGITTDFHIARTKVAWPGIQVVSETDQHVVLSRKQSQKVMVLRQDMFAGREQWLQFLSLLPR